MIKRFSSQYLGMNSTVVFKDNSAFVVDPGVFPKEIYRIQAFLKEKKIDNISVLLTHTHGDHIS